ncbi:KOW domain-containing RNA-binding protein [Limnochorda pilosa]|uniref:50S ribosomal protein L14 n=1 Tax=Limnochorda pilosa TaxID=1555112 RepID=A0A0K2SPP0_LIMPI|nr:KOW domain-containing RNA-binding protein [Limnochorda pilosa]BAS29066.1 50S ribosomal protein L14 [Limnochorda pilosa]
MARKPELGGRVTSRAGRDEGRCYMVVGLADERTVLVSDGERHPVSRPKRKNLRHLWLHPQVDRELGRRLEAGEPVNDREVRARIAAWMAADAPAETGSETAGGAE